MFRQSLVLASAGVLLSACQGRIGGGLAGPAAPSGSGGASSGTGGSSPMQDCSKPQAAAVRLRLLSESQYNNAVLDLVQVGGSPGQGLGDKAFAALDDTSVELRANAAATVASQAAATLSKWAPCTPPATGSATACEQQIIDKIGARAYRHPLADSERSELKTLFDAGIQEKDFATGVEWFLSGLLQSPDFMYEVVRPDLTERVGDVVALSAYEYGSRLAFFLWDGPPDDQLTTAAANNDLADPTKRQTQLSRMVADPRFSRGLARFYSTWLNLGAFNEAARNDAGFDLNLVTALSTSLLMSATQLYSSANPNISALFSGESYYLNDVLRSFYGVSGTGTSFTLTPMTGQARRGILTHPALMALLARPGESNPIARGLFVLRTVLCKKIPPPPQNITIPQLPPVQDGVSTRQRLEMHASNMLCATCHDRIDPAGFVFESFDEVGRFRTTDHGQPVDTSGTLTAGSDVDGSFTNGDQFLAKLADSTTVRSCFAEKYLDFSLSRQETDPADTCSIQALGQTFSGSGDLNQLVTSVATSDSFRLRLAEGVGQ